MLSQHEQITYLKEKEVNGKKFSNTGNKCKTK